MPPGLTQVEMDARHWVHPIDAEGRRHGVDALPKHVKGLVDDPYRSLAGYVRDAGAYVKTEPRAQPGGAPPARLPVGARQLSPIVARPGATIHASASDRLRRGSAYHHGAQRTPHAVNAPALRHHRSGCGRSTSLGGESIASAGGTPITSTSCKHHDRREVKKLGADANAIAWWLVFTELLIWEAQPGSAARITGAREGRRRNARVPRGHLVEIEHVLQRGRVLVTRGQVRPRTSTAGKAEEALLDEGEQ